MLSSFNNDLAEMQIMLEKGTLKFELTERCTMSDTKPFSENGDRRLEGYHTGRRKCILTEFVILLKFTLNQRKTSFSLAEAGVREGIEWRKGA